MQGLTWIHVADDIDGSNVWKEKNVERVINGVENKDGNRNWERKKESQ